MSKFFHFTWSVSLIWLVFQFVLKPWNDHRFRSIKHVMRTFEQVYYIILHLYLRFTGCNCWPIFFKFCLNHPFGKSLGRFRWPKESNNYFPPLGGGRCPKFWFWNPKQFFQQVSFFPVKYSRARFSKVLSQFVTCLVICFYIYYEKWIKSGLKMYYK